MVATTSWQKINPTTYMHPLEGGGEAYASRSFGHGGTDYCLAIDIAGRRIEAVWNTAEGGRVLKAPKNREDIETLSKKLPHSCIRHLPAGIETIIEGYLFRQLGVERGKKK